MNMYALPNFFIQVLWGPIVPFVFLSFVFVLLVFLPVFFVLGLMLMSFCLVCRTLAIINPHSIGASNQIRPRLYFLAKMV